MESSSSKNNGVIINNELEKRIVEAFEIFDYTGNKMIDAREVGPVLCSLGCVPTKSDIKEIVENVREAEFPDRVHLSKFLPVISNLITKYKFYPSSAEQLLKAFQILDKNKTGYISKDHMCDLMTEKGEPFNSEEVEAMLAIAMDPKTGTIPYEYYINHIMVRLIFRYKFNLNSSLDLYCHH